MSNSPARGDIWKTDAGISVLVMSSTGYTERVREPTLVIGPVFATEPDTGVGVDLADGWAAPGLVPSLPKAQLSDHRRRIDIQTLTDVNNMLVKILTTPDR